MARKIRKTTIAPTQPGTGDGCPAPDTLASARSADDGAVEREARRIHLLVSTVLPDGWRDEFEADLTSANGDDGDRLATLRTWQGRIERKIDALQAELAEARKALRNVGVHDPDAIKGTPNGSPNVAGLQVEFWYWKWADARDEIAAWLGDL